MNRGRLGSKKQWVTEGWWHNHRQAGLRGSLGTFYVKIQEKFHEKCWVFIWILLNLQFEKSAE